MTKRISTLLIFLIFALMSFPHTHSLTHKHTHTCTQNSVSPTKICFSITLYTMDYLTFISNTNNNNNNINV